MASRIPAARARLRIVLVLPTDGYRTSAFLKAAAALDVDVVVATNDAPPLATTMEDRLVIVDFDDPEGSATRIAAIADREKVDAVVGVDDQGALTAAHANELLGLVNHPPDAVAATRDKADMRSIFSAWSVPQPAFRVARPGADIAALATDVGLPCVIKPVSLSASTGVIRADSAAEAEEVAERVRRIAIAHDRPAEEPLLVEEFVAGAEVSLEGLMVNGTLEVLALFDKPDPLDGPYFEETIYVTPSTLSPDQHAGVIGAAEAGCRALGLHHGPVHAELRISPSGVRVIEVAARSIGGLCSKVLQFGSDISLEEVILRNALGLGTAGLGTRPLGIRGSAGASGVMMLPIPRTGILLAVEGTAEARAVPGITGLEITASPGRLIEALPEGGRYLGFMFARAETPRAVVSALRDAHAALRVHVIDPSEYVRGEPASDGQATPVSVGPMKGVTPMEPGS